MARCIRVHLLPTSTASSCGPRLRPALHHAVRVYMRRCVCQALCMARCMYRAMHMARCIHSALHMPDVARIYSALYICRALCMLRCIRVQPLPTSTASSCGPRLCLPSHCPVCTSRHVQRPVYTSHGIQHTAFHAPHRPRSLRIPEQHVQCAI